MCSYRIGITGALLAAACLLAGVTSAFAQLTITTVAGDTSLSAPAPNGFTGDGGPATRARMAEPYGVALDAAGNIYIADTRNNRIRKVTVSTGIITTYAGDGTAAFGGDGGAATSASLNQPTGVAVDAAGNLFIADQKNNRIRKVSTSGVISTVVGNGQNAVYSGENGPAVNAHICFPYDVAVDSAGNIYLTDTGNMAVRKVTTDGKIHTFAGVGVSQCGLPGGFSGDQAQTATSANLDNPNGLAVDAAGNVYIADTWNNRVRKVTAAGVMTTIAGTGATTSKNGANVQVNPDGTLKTNGGYNGDGIPASGATLNWPYGVAVDGSGNLYISDYFNYRIREIVGGVITTVAGNGLSGYDGDGGSSTVAYISDPANVAVDSAGNVYIVDQASNRIRKVFPTPAPTDTPPAVTMNPSNVFTTLGGPATFQASATGTPAPAAQWQVSTGGPFSNIAGATGNVYSFGATAADNGKQFRVVFTNSSGTATTTAASLFVRIPRPPASDVDGDAIGDLTVWRPGSGTWFSLTSRSGYSYNSYQSHQWGSQSAGDKPFLGDIDGDGIADLVVWRASTGTWYWLTSSSGYSPAAAGARQWGSQSVGDIPMLGDLDGDGRADLVVWRASTGTWYWLTSSSGYSPSAAGARQWGSQGAGDVPMVGDIDGDGKADLVVWRASTGTWYWLTSSSGFSYGSAMSKQWGSQSLGDVPLLGDIDGDGRMDLVVWRAQTGTWYWLTSANNYASAFGLPWGSQSAGDIPLLTDLDGDGKADLTVWRASNGTWYWLKSLAGYSYNAAGAIQWGSQALGDIPVVK
jgi:sugar lactone lactonase YvrE